MGISGGRSAIRFPVSERPKLMSNAMGSKGFNLNPDGSFTSDAGTKVVMGYEKGVFELNYYFNAADAQPLPRVSRKE